MWPKLAKKDTRTTWTDMDTQLNDVAHDGVFLFNFKQTLLLVPLFLQAIFYSVKIFARGIFLELKILYGKIQPISICSTVKKRKKN